MPLINCEVEVKRLFVFAYDNTVDDQVSVDSCQKYLLLRVKIEN